MRARGLRDCRSFPTRCSELDRERVGPLDEKISPRQANFGYVINAYFKRLSLFIILHVDTKGAPSELDVEKRNVEVRLQWSRRNEAHPFCAPIIQNVYQPHTKKVVSITPVPPPSPAQPQFEDLDVSEAQVLEAARELEKEEEASTFTTADAEAVKKSVEPSP